MLKSVGELLGLALHNANLERENLRATVAGERQMMAAEVHDSVAQTLAFVKMRMPLLEEAVLEHDDARSLRYIGEVRQALSRRTAACARSSATSVRRSIRRACCMRCR